MASMSGYAYNESGTSSSSYVIGSSINNLGNKIIKLSQDGWIDTFFRILTLFVSIYIIVISATNIAAYAYILNRDKEDPDISKTWCTALIVLNGLLLVTAIMIMVFTIIDFFKKKSKTKNIATTALQIKTLSAIEGVGDALKVAENQVQLDTAANLGVEKAESNGYKSIKAAYKTAVANLSAYQGAIPFDLSTYSVPPPPIRYSNDVLKAAAAIVAAGGQ